MRRPVFRFCYRNKEHITPHGGYGDWERDLLIEGALAEVGESK